MPQNREQYPQSPTRKRTKLAPPDATAKGPLGPKTVVHQSNSAESSNSTRPVTLQAAIPAAHGNLEGGGLEQADQTGRSDVSTYETTHPNIIAALNEKHAPVVPSIYFSSPLDSLKEQINSDVGSLQSQRVEKRLGVHIQRQADFLTYTNNAQSPEPDNDFNIPKRDLRGMVRIYCEKILPNVSLLSAQDFQDVDHLIETDFPLVCCMCYVTAQFLSGGKQLREMLMPKVAQILRGKFNSGWNQSNEMSTLKALIVLYSYANTSPPSPQESETIRPEEILYWPLKSLVEVYALRLGLHRSVYDLQEELRSEVSRPIVENLSYQKYTMWLQLFVMAKYASVASSTPPSIPIDSTIRAAPSLMTEIGMGPQAALFAEVELAIIWEKVGHQGQLGEWWCLCDPSKIIDERETESMLREADQLIDIWYEKWSNYINGEEGRGPRIDFLGRCTRFSINSYATRSLRSAAAGLTHVHIAQIHTCVGYASRVLDWPLDLSPFQKESLRYVPESASIMVSYCCLFTIASCQTFRSSMPDIYTILDKVDATAQLLLYMAPDTLHNAYTQGLLISRRSKALRKQLQDSESETVGNKESNTLADLGGSDTGDVFDFNFHAEGIAALEMFWDFPMLTPRMW